MTQIPLIFLPVNVNIHEIHWLNFTITIAVNIIYILSIVQKRYLILSSVLIRIITLFWNYVKVMPWLSGNFLFDYTAPVTTPQITTSQKNEIVQRKKLTATIFFHNAKWPEGKTGDTIIGTFIAASRKIDSNNYKLVFW